MQTVGYQGEPGAFGEEAVFRHFARIGQPAEPRGYPTFAATFEAFKIGETDLAMLPVENSYAGSVHEVYDLILDAPEAVAVAEVVLPVHHCLLAPPGTRIEEIRRVRSHPQALAQCAPFLNAHGMSAEAFGDTAGCAREVAEERPEGIGAIASAAAARRYGLEILSENIEATVDNRTRFLLLGRETAPYTPPSRTSLVLWLAHSPGTLAACLSAAANEGLNLTKIESRPSRAAPWEYVFYLDFEGHPEEVRVRAALREMERHCERLRIIGAYAASPEPIEDSDA